MVMKRHTAVIPPPRPSTETLVTLCWKGADLVTAVPVCVCVWDGGLVGGFQLDTVD